MTCLYLLPILHEYRRLYPEVHITVQRALGSRVPAQVLDYGADFGVITFRPDTTALNSIVVYHDELAFVVPPTHPLARRAKVSISELAQRIVRRASRVIAVSSTGDRDVPQETRRAADAGRDADDRCDQEIRGDG